ncbi:MAG: DUF4058 family protein [Anaerolineae bacterium]|nr:DUF4058 family protein [Anaerolineae bacterium]
MPTSAYTQLLSQGPFAGRPDPFAEDDHYFHQIHSGIIEGILEQIWQPLLENGYYISKEASLQIAAMRKPDIGVLDTGKPRSGKKLVYEAVSEALLVESGIFAEPDEPDLYAIRIHQMGTGELVTIVEIVSPGNKISGLDILKYQEGRRRTFLETGVNVVEIDLTRSVKRLFEHPLTTQYPYHIAVFIPGETPRILPMRWDAPLKRFALPLLEDGIAVNLQQAYDSAYRKSMIAPQLEWNDIYATLALEFPSLFNDDEMTQITQAVTHWHDELARLRTS